MSPSANSLLQHMLQETDYLLRVLCHGLILGLSRRR